MVNAWNRRQFVHRGLAFGSGIGLAAACRQADSATVQSRDADWAEPPDLERAKAQAKEFVTYGVPTDWANYGEVIDQFAQTYGFELNHIDTDMASLTEITKFDLEKQNPRAICGDIGLLYGAIATRRQVVPPYLPPTASRLPAGLKGATGGWVATYTGVPALVVNTDVVPTPPQTWEDLLNPAYTGKVSSLNPVRAGNSATAFLAWSYAFGGDETDMAAAVDFAKALLPQLAAVPANHQTLEKGEVPIQINYDFNCIHAAERLKAKNIGAEVIIPGVSIYAPSAMMVNRYHRQKMDVAKLFLDFVLSEAAQTAFAKFGARPIRYVLGDLALPDAAKARWLPDDRYAQVQQVKDWTQVDAEAIGQIWQQQVLGG